MNNKYHQLHKSHQQTYLKQVEEIVKKQCCYQYNKYTHHPTYSPLEQIHTFITYRVQLKVDNCKLTIIILLLLEILFVPVLGGQGLRLCNPEMPVTCQYGGTCTRVKIFTGTWHRLQYFRRRHPGINPISTHVCKCPQINCHKSGFHFQCGSDGR